MEGNSNWKPNEQGGDTAASNANNDWRSQHEHDLRKKVLFAIVKKLKKLFPNHGQNEINKAAVKFEDSVYRTATNKDDYFLKIKDKLLMTEKTTQKAQSNSVQSRSSVVNGTDTSGPAAQVPNQGQSLPTSLPYTQTPTSQQCLPQTIQSKLNIPGSSGLQTQVPTTVSAAQNANIQVGEGVHSNLLPGSQRQIQGRQHLLPQQPQSSSHMIQNLVDQQLLKDKTRHGNLPSPHMQQKQSLLKQPFQQQLPHQTSLSTIQQPSPQSSALSSLPSPGQQNSQFLPRHQFPTQRVHSSQQQQIAVPSLDKQLEQQHLISQLMNGQDTQQNLVRPGQNNGEQQGAFRVSSPQIASFQPMAQQNNNLQNVHQEQRFSSHSNNASPLPSPQQQNIGNINFPGSSLLGTQGQEVGQSQPMMSRQYQTQHPVHQQQPQNRILQQRLDATQRFQAAGSLRQTQNVADQHNQPYQLQRPPPTNPSTSQDSTGKTVNSSGGAWQEETYQKIKALMEMYIHLLCTMLEKVTDKLRQIDSLPQQKILYEPTEKLRAIKSTLEQVIVFLNVRRNGITEKHRDMFSMYEEYVLRLSKSQTGTWRPITQQQQGQLPPSQIHQTSLQSQSGQVHVSQSLDNGQMNSRLMPPSHQNGASSSASGLTTSQTAMPHSLQTRPNMASLKQNPASNPQDVHMNISLVQPSLSQQQPRQMQPQPLHRKQHQQQLQPSQQLQTNEMNDAKMRQGINVKARLLQQNLSTSQLLKAQASQGFMSNSSPQQILPATVGRNGTPSQSGGSPFVTPSPVTSFALSPVPGDPEKPISVESPVWRSRQLQTAAQEHPLVTLPPKPIAERPIDRLIKALQSSSQRSLAQSVSEMSSVISLSDRLAGSVHSIGGSRAGIAEDLSARTQFRLQQGETNPTKRLKRSICTLPLDIASHTDSYKQFNSLESEVDSTASSGSKVNKLEPGFALLQEINEINGRLVETVVNICNEEGTSGTIVTCSYAPVALSATFEAHYKSGHISQIQPLRLLVPADYPYSPVFLLENISFDASVHEFEDLSARTRSRFSMSMKEFSGSMSLKEIAQAWDDCARATMAEYADRYGGGTFSSKYGHWETVIRGS